ncbi:MAG: ABC transporter permease [Acidobacteriota bacterium]
MRIIINFIQKEFIQLRRDPRMFPILFIAPVLQLIILGYVATLDIKEIPTVVCDLDNSKQSREILKSFSNSGYFSFRYFVDSPKHIDKYLESGKAIVSITIPKGFIKEIKRGRGTDIQLLFDASDANTANIARNYSQMISMNYSKISLTKHHSRLKILQKERASQINAEPRVWYNPELKSSNFMVPAVVCLILTVMTTILTAMAIVKEKEMGTLEQIIVTPIKPFQLILGKLLPFTIIGFIDVILVVVIGTFWFKVPIKGSVLLLFALSSLFLLTSLGLGLFISTISKTQQQAMVTSAFFIMFPSIILSGFIFPINNMPKIIQAITYIIPLRYFLTIIRNIFLKGTGIEFLWDETLALFLLGVIIMTLSVIRFRKKLD